MKLELKRDMVDLMVDPFGSTRDCIEVKLLLEGILAPSHLPRIVQKAKEILKEGDSQYPIFITGDAPEWVFEALAHVMHSDVAQGCYDPRIQKYVVTKTNSEDFALGDDLL